MALFKELNPDLLIEYDYEKNESLGLDLNTISPSSDRRVFWRCHVCGGIWEASLQRETGIEVAHIVQGKKYYQATMIWQVGFLM